MITLKRLRELISDLPDHVQAFGYEGESTGLSLFNPETNKYGFIHTGDENSPGDESEHDIADLVQGSEYFVPLPPGVEAT